MDYQANKRRIQHPSLNKGKHNSCIVLVSHIYYKYESIFPDFPVSFLLRVIISLAYIL